MLGNVIIVHRAPFWAHTRPSWKLCWVMLDIIGVLDTTLLPKLLSPLLAWATSRPPARRRLPATGHRPPATGHRPPAPCPRPPATGHRPPATGPLPPATGHRPPATGHRPNHRPSQKKSIAPTTGPSWKLNNLSENHQRKKETPVVGFGVWEEISLEFWAPQKRTPKTSKHQPRRQPRSLVF